MNKILMTVVMLGMTGGAYTAEFSDLAVKAAGLKALAAVDGITRGYVAANDPVVTTPSQAVEFVTINGGKFSMGIDNGEKGFEDSKPIHEVTIKTFDMSKTAVTVEQYAECVIKGGCTEPGTGGYCNG